MSLIMKYLTILAVSMLPIVELRGAIPIASGMDIDLMYAFPIAIIGNMIPVPFILLFFKYVYKWLQNVKHIGPWLTKINEKAEAKAGELANKEFWGIFIFVAIPLPGTGAWTGSLIATFLGMRFKKSLLAVLLGVLTAGIIMSVISYALPSVFKALF